MNQYPRLNNLASFTSMDIDILSGDFGKLAINQIGDSDSPFTIAYICLDDETLSLQTGLRLNHQFRKYQVSFVMRMSESGGLAKLIDKKTGEGNTFANLRVFDLLDQTCTVDLLQRGTHEILARNLHEVYLEGLRQRGTSDESDPAQATWEALTEDLKENNRQLADRIPDMLAKIGYRIAPLTDWDAEKLQFKENQVTLMARMEHQSWMDRKKQEGWRYGPEKDPRKKTNPSLLLWEELPEGEQGKNREFILGLPRLLAQAGFQVESD